MYEVKWESIIQSSREHLLCKYNILGSAKLKGYDTDCYVVILYYTSKGH